MTSAWPALDRSLSQRTFAIVMAGGNGTRLGTLTRLDAKPALPFAGQYRNIDFTLSNCVNSGLRRIAVATQYKAHSLIQHLSRNWDFLRPELGDGIEVWPAQQRCGERWYAGTADAIRQNLDLIAAHAPDHVLVLSGDHVYRMDYRPMLYEHAANNADVTVACVEIPVSHAVEFGVLEIDARCRVTGCAEKPESPQECPRGSGLALASMGVYVFERAALERCLGASGGSGHDFGYDILPMLIGGGNVFAYTFRDARRGGPGYWRDVGTITSYWRAHMDLLEDEPLFELEDAEWPLLPHSGQHAPASFAGSSAVTRSIVSGGCRIAGAVERCVLAPGCKIEPDARVERSVLMPDVQVGAGARLRDAIVEHGCRIPAGLEIGPDLCPAGVVAGERETGVVLVTAELVERAVADAAPELARASGR